MALEAAAARASRHVPGPSRPPPARPHPARGRRRARARGHRRHAGVAHLASLARPAGAREPGPGARDRARAGADRGDQARLPRQPVQERRRGDLRRRRRLVAGLDPAPRCRGRGEPRAERAAHRPGPAGQGADPGRRQRSGRRLRVLHAAGRAEAAVRGAADGHVHRLPGRARRGPGDPRGHRPRAERSARRPAVPADRPSVPGAPRSLGATGAPEGPAVRSPTGTFGRGRLRRP
jgi:hypothetical protein